MHCLLIVICCTYDLFPDFPLKMAIIFLLLQLFYIIVCSSFCLMFYFTHYSTWGTIKLIITKPDCSDFFLRKYWIFSRFFWIKIRYIWNPDTLISRDTVIWLYKLVYASIWRVYTHNTAINFSYLGIIIRCLNMTAYTTHVNYMLCWIQK